MVFMHYETKKDLDQLIHAHSQYLNHVAEKCFLVAVDGSDVPLAQKMRTLFQIVLEFQKSHVRVTLSHGFRKIYSQVL